jgi:hypothetical protein
MRDRHARSRHDRDCAGVSGLRAPSGTFRLNQFSAVRYRPIVAGPRPGRDWIRDGGVLSLVGKPGVPDIVFARPLADESVAMGRTFAAELGLAFEDMRTSFTLGQTAQTDGQ